MSFAAIQFCPGTLAPGNDTYSRTCLKRVFYGKLVSHILSYASPATYADIDELFEENRNRMSISGVQEKFSLILDKNKLRLIEEGEQGNYILKPIPTAGRRPDQMPANEHLTMQIARQVYGIETAENALIFFADGTQGYITKRFDRLPDGRKRAQDDFASLAGRTSQTYGAHYKYLGSYLDIFELMRKYLPAYAVESPKLLRTLMFNYLFSNGDAHLKNFSILETDQGDYRLSPAYDLLNSRIHIRDKDFALDDGLLPKKLAQGKVMQQFTLLAELAGINSKVFGGIVSRMSVGSEHVEQLIFASFLDDATKRNYLQAYQGRLKEFLKG